MEIQIKSRQTGYTLEACKAIVPTLQKFEKVFVAGEIYPAKIIETLHSLGVKVIAEPHYTTQRLEPVYDDLLAIEPNIIGFTQEPKKLTGHYLIPIE